MMRSPILSAMISHLIVGSTMVAAAQAQIAGDGTLGTQVNGSLLASCDSGSCLITNGTLRGSNLFHSFGQFSLRNPADTALFVNAPTVQTVIARVTGVGNPFISTINGRITTTNPANFFLLNPNGIVFGPGASLNIGGSFLATTADRLLFPNRIEFRTSDPAPLLTVNVPIGLGFTRTPSPIQLRSSFLAAGTLDNFSNFALVGGNIQVDNTFIQTPDRSVAIQSVGAPGNVGLTLQGNQLKLTLPPTLPRGDVALTNGSTVNVTARGEGEIEIAGRNITMTGGSRLEGGILQAIGTTDRAGTITLDATEAIAITGGGVFNQIVQASGVSGDVQMNARSLTLRQGAQVNTSNGFGSGKGGNITIRVQDAVVADGVSAPDPTSGIISSSAIGSVVFGLGIGGDINISAGSLSFTNSAQINTSVLGLGNAGNINIAARDSIFFDGNNSTPSLPGTSGVSGIGSVTLGAGQGGNIQISTGSLRFVGAAQINASVAGLSGIAGNITIQARDSMLFDGLQTNGEQGGGIFSTLEAIAGRGGDVQLGASQLTFANGAQLNTSTLGLSGDGGNILITVDSLDLLNGSLLGSVTKSSGSAGDVTIQARGRVFLGGLNSGITTTTGSTGQGGDIAIQADSVFVTDNAIIISGTVGFGDSGTISIQARDRVVLSSSGSSLFSLTFGNGRGGDIFVTTNSVTLSEGAGILAGTLGSGNSGKVMIRATDQLSLDNSTISSGSFFFRDILLALQSTGTINQFDPEQLRRAIEFVNTLGENAGISGDIDIEARSIRLDRGSSISASAISGKGGNIQLNAKELLLLRRNSTITTRSGILSTPEVGIGFGGSGGNITINALFVVAAPLENSDIIANAFGGAGGRLTINAQGIYWLTPRSRADLERLLRTTNPFELDPQRLPTNDITSFSQSNPAIADQVFINTPDIDPSRGLQQLPASLVDPSQQIAQTCQPRNAQRTGAFTVTGRGGLPSSPTDPFTDEMGITDWVSANSPIVQNSENQVETGTDPTGNQLETSITSPSQASEQVIVEANSWSLDNQGNVMLVAITATNPALPRLPTLCNQ